jgi:hypothetical protein
VRRRLLATDQGEILWQEMRLATADRAADQGDLAIGGGVAPGADATRWAV